MRVVVFGATGKTGRLLVERGLAAGHEVTAFARNPSDVPEARSGGIHIVRGDVLQPTTIESAIQRQQAVVSALGPAARHPSPVLSQGIRNVLDAMEAQGVRRIVCLTTAGAMHEDAGFFLGNLVLSLGRRALPNVFREHERMLREIEGRDLDWTVVRAPLLTNGRPRGRYRIAIEGLPRGGLRISRSDVAEFMMNELANRKFVRQLPAVAY